MAVISPSELEGPKSMCTEQTKNATDTLSPVSSRKRVIQDGASENSIIYGWAARCPEIKAAAPVLPVLSESQSLSCAIQATGKTTPTCTSDKRKGLTGEWGV